MTRYWSLLLIVTFVVGFTFKSYLTSQDSITAENEKALTQKDFSKLVLLGENNQAVPLFNSTNALNGDSKNNTEDNREDNRIRVIYFGFTRCPDVCPTSLAMLSSALNEITDQQRAKLRPIFISLDPERDAANASHEYAQYFHANLEGLTGSLAVVTKLANHYGVVFKKTVLTDSTLKYTLDHNSYFYFIKPDGTLITKVPHTFSPEPLVTKINELLAQKSIIPSTEYLTPNT